MNVLAQVLGLLLTCGVLGLGLAGLITLLRIRQRNPARWRAATIVPMAITGFVVLRIVIDLARDPTSHNLWPLEIVLAGLASTALMGILMFLRWLVGKRE